MASLMLFSALLVSFASQVASAPIEAAVDPSNVAAAMLLLDRQNNRPNNDYGVNNPSRDAGWPDLGNVGNSGRDPWGGLGDPLRNGDGNGNNNGFGQPGFPSPQNSPGMRTGTGRDGFGNAGDGLGNGGNDLGNGGNGLSNGGNGLGNGRDGQGNGGGLPFPPFGAPTIRPVMAPTNAAPDYDPAAAPSTSLASADYESTAPPSTSAAYYDATTTDGAQYDYESTASSAYVDYGNAITTQSSK